MPFRFAALLAVGLMVLAAGCETVSTEVSSPIVEAKQTTYEVPLDGATSAEITLNSLVSAVNIEPLDPSSPLLLYAEIGYVGELTTTSEGDALKKVVISDEMTSFSYNGSPLAFDVDLNWLPSISLEVTSMSGDANLNLRDFNLNRLSVSTASGEVEAQLPASAGVYPVNVSTASGDVSLTLADGAAVQFESITTASGNVSITSGDGGALAGTSIDTSSGNITLTFNGPVTAGFRVGTASGDITVEAPDGVPVRLEVVSNVSGSVTVPEDMPQIQGEGDLGIWEQTGFQDTEQRILIVVTTNVSGGITIR